MSRQAKVIQFKAKAHQVTQVAPDRFTVESGASGNVYNVSITPVGPRCSCDWGKFRRAGEPCGCSHVVSVLNHLAQQDGRKVSAWADEESAARQHRPVIQLGDGLTLTTRKAA